MTIICKYENNYQMRQYFLHEFSTTRFGQPNAFASTFYFYLRTMQTHKKIKRACKQTHEGHCKLDTTNAMTYNTTTTNRKKLNETTFSITHYDNYSDQYFCTDNRHHFVYKIKTNVRSRPCKKT